MHIQTIRDPRALLNPEVYKLLERAFAATELAPGGVGSVAQELFQIVTGKQGHLVIGAEADAEGNSSWRAVALMYLPNSQLFPRPLVQLFYNEGSRALRGALSDKLMDIATAAGYTKAWAVNTSGRDDKVWARAFSGQKRTAKHLGSVFEIGVK